MPNRQRSLFELNPNNSFHFLRLPALVFLIFVVVAGALYCAVDAALAQQDATLSSMSNEELLRRAHDALSGGDGQAASPYLKVMADRGHAISQYVLGQLYASGIPVRDDKQAVLLYRKSAEQGYAPAQTKLGRAYRDGIGGLNANYPQALDWFTKATAQDDVSAKAAIGDLFEKGKGVPLDYGKAMEWYLKVADRDDFAAFAIGRLYFNGWGVQKDHTKAAQWFHKAASIGEGFASAKVWLANMYLDGDGVRKDPTESVKWYRQAAAQGDDGGQYGLGVLYHEGIGVERDLGTARSWLKKAADQGHEKARTALMRMDRESQPTPFSLRDKLPPAIQFRCVWEGGAPAAAEANGAGIDAAYVACARKEWKRLFGSAPFPGDP